MKMKTYQTGCYVRNLSLFSILLILYRDLSHKSICFGSFHTMYSYLGKITTMSQVAGGYSIDHTHIMRLLVNTAGDRKSGSFGFRKITSNTWTE